MKVLLFNDNPVVSKLVTLSAQKTGDELEVCSDIEALNPGEFDLLIVDDALYNDENILALGTSITAKKHLFMSKRGVDKPEDFEYSINKPFLPTDLVELFTTISSSFERVEADKDEESFVLEDFDDELVLEDDDSLELDLSDDSDDDIASLGIDDVEADDEMLLDLEDFNDEDSTEDLALDESEESILDKDDLAEVQSLLDDAETPLEEDNAVEELDDVDGLELDENLTLDDDIELEEELSELEDSDEVDIEEDDLDLSLDDDIKEDDLDLNLDDDIEEDENDLNIEDVLEPSMDDKAMDEDSLSELEDEIESAVSELSDEDLQESVDEDTLLDIVSSDEDMNNFSSLDDLDEQSLKIAVGEAEASDFELEDEVNQIPIQKSIQNNSKVEGVDALKALLKALESEDVAKSLNGMNININISFGDKN
jgi:uncharacterized membrane protein